MDKLNVLQYKIPQNVGIEDRIVGPFSLRQLMILAGGGGISYILFVVSAKAYDLNIFEYFLIALPALFSLAAATLKIYNVSFMRYIFLMLEFVIKPKKRMWDHRGISALITPDLSEKSSEPIKKNDKNNRQDVNLQELSDMLDSGGFGQIKPITHEDIDRVSDEDLLTEAYFGHKKKDSPTQNMYWRTREIQKKKLEILAKIKPTAPRDTAALPAVIPTPIPMLTAQPSEIKPLGKEESKPKVVIEQVKKKEIQPESKTTIKISDVTLTAKKPAPPRAPEPPEKATTPKPTAALGTPPNMPTPAKSPIMTTESFSGTDQAPKKKKRKRKRKSKNGQPVRQDTQIDTTKKFEPVKLTQNKKTRPLERETSFSDLTKGGEIEFNLD